MRQRGLGAWGIQTGPFAVHWAHFVPKDFHLFHLHTGRPILITPEGQLWEKGVLPTPKLDETEGFGCLGHSNWTICSPLHLSHSEIIPSFPPSYWEANSYYPRGQIMGKGEFLDELTNPHSLRFHFLSRKVAKWTPPPPPPRGSFCHSTT